MPLSIQFRWKTPQTTTVQSQWDRDKMSEGLNQVANTILAVKERRYKKEQDERRNKIEDEDRTRRMEEEDRKKKAWMETSDLIRGKKAERDRLVAQRQQIASRIEALKAQIGGL